MRDDLKLDLGWRATTLGRIAEIRRGASPRPINDPKWFRKDGPGWVRIADVTRSNRTLRHTEQMLSPLGVEKSVQVHPGDLIMSICATIGKPIILGMEACIHDGFVLFSKLSDTVDRVFLYYFLQAKEREFSGKGQPGTQKNLNTTIVGDTEILVPPLPEQRKIAAILSSVDDAIEKSSAVIDQLEVVKKALLQQIFKDGLGMREVWPSKTLRDLLSLEYGAALPEKTRKPGPFPVFGSNGVVGSHQSSLVPGPGIVVGRKGSAGEVRWSDTDFWPIDTTYYVKPDAMVDLRWSYFLLQSLKLTDLKSASGVPGLNRNDAYERIVALPPLPEQRKIAAILSSVDEAIEKDNSALEQLKAMKTSLLSKLLSGQLRVNLDEASP